MKQSYSYRENIRDHPRAKRNSRDKLPVHILVAEKALGKYLPLRAVVHHVDGNGLNNENNNLVVCENTQYHWLLHMRARAYYACGNANWKKCTKCHSYSPIDNLIASRKKKGGYYHKNCKKEAVVSILESYSLGKISKELAIKQINKLI